MQGAERLLGHELTGGPELTAGERREAEGLVELAERLSLLKLRASKPGPVAA